MKHQRLLIGGLLLGAALSSSLLCAGPRLRLDPGEAEVLYTFQAALPSFASAEGIAVDHQGNLIVSLRTHDGTQLLHNEIVEIRPDGQSTVLTDLGPALDNGVLGVATDAYGTVYVAFNAGNENHGVWKVYRSGNTEHLPGSEDINVPNALTLDQHGNVYVTDYRPYTDTDPGLVWRYQQGGAFEVWAASYLLAPDPDFNPFPATLGGANGIVFGPPHDLYVANTEKSLIVHIPVRPDGSAGEVSVVAGIYPPVGPPGLLTSPDGLAMDAKGMLYAAVPPTGITGFPLSPVIRIDPSTGAVEAVVEPYVALSPLFDFPTSLAFGRGKLDRKSLYVASMGARAFGLPPGVGAGSRITQVGAGTPGQAGP